MLDDERGEDRLFIFNLRWRESTFNKGNLENKNKGDRKGDRY